MYVDIFVMEIFTTMYMNPYNGCGFNQTKKTSYDFLSRIQIFKKSGVRNSMM